MQPVNLRNMIKQKDNVKIRLTVWDKEGKKHEYMKMSPSRFASMKGLREMKKYYVYADYGISKNVWGKMVRFHNDGTYDNYEDALAVMKDFIDDAD